MRRLGSGARRRMEASWEVPLSEPSQHRRVVIGEDMTVTCETCLSGVFF